MLRQKTNIYALIFFAAMAFFSCQTSEFDEISFSDISVSTTEVNISEFSATVSGRIEVLQLFKEGVPMSRGIVWSNINELPDISVDDFEFKTVDIAEEDFTVEVAPIETGLIYYARAFAEIADSVIYGETLSFSLNWLSLNTPVNAPTPRENMTVVNTGQDVLLAFGNDADQIFRNSWLYSGSVWSQTSSSFSGIKRTGAVGFSINGTSYVGLGVNEQGELLSDFWTYNAGTGWESQPSAFPTKAEGAIAFSAGGKGYVGMGKSFSDFYNQLYELGQDGIWQVVDNQGTVAPVGRSDAVVFVDGEKAYIGLGRSEAGLVDDFFAFNSADGTWEELPPFPGGARIGAIAFILEGKGYVGMGLSDNGLEKDIWQFDPSKSDPWKFVTQFPDSPKSNMSVFTFEDGKAFIGLGKISNTYSSDWWEFTPNSD